uniref:Ionotropic glutamate receptor L-glutamate and glycine-binding domain-containing protein n=1 Tax=Anopheles culicifacies TaxID=139723 RepID=A0A182LVN5_9DIPT
MLVGVRFGALGCILLSISKVYSRLPALTDNFKLLSTVSLLDRILLEANSLPIETYTLVATDEPFFRDVIDGLAWRSNALMVPTFNNAVPLYVPNRQLVIAGSDDINTIMDSLVKVFSKHQPNFFAANSRNIYVVLVLSDIRYLNSVIVLFLYEYFTSINFIVVSPPVTQFQPPIVVGSDYEFNMVIIPHHLSMRQMFADRFKPERYAVVQVRGYDAVTARSIDKYGHPPGYDWTVFETILKHMKLRWKLVTIRAEPSVQLMEWFNQQLDKGHIHLLLDRSFRANLSSVSHVLPEMNGACLVIPKTEKYQVLQHLLRPLQPTSWVALGVLLLVGSYLANRYFKNSLAATLIFGVDLNASTISRTERTVLFASLLVFFILSEAYQAKLLALMSSGRYPPDPKTVAEFLQTDIKLHLGTATGTVLSYRPGFKKHIRNETDQMFSYDGGQTYGVLLKCPFAWDMYVRWINKEYDLNGYNVRPQVHVVREKILSLPAAYTFSRTFFLYPWFKRYLSQIFESGLMAHWQTKQDRQRQYEQKFEFVENEIITFSDLGGLGDLGATPRTKRQDWSSKLIRAVT